MAASLNNTDTNIIHNIYTAASLELCRIIYVNSQLTGQSTFLTFKHTAKQFIYLEIILLQYLINVHFIAILI